MINILSPKHSLRSVASTIEKGLGDESVYLSDYFVAGGDQTTTIIGDQIGGDKHTYVVNNTDPEFAKLKEELKIKREALQKELKHTQDETIKAELNRQIADPEDDVTAQRFSQIKDGFSYIPLQKAREKIKKISEFLGIAGMFLALKKLMMRFKFVDILVRTLGTIIILIVPIVALIIAIFKWAQGPIQRFLNGMARLLGIKLTLADYVAVLSIINLIRH